MRKIEVLGNGNVRVTIPIVLRSCSGRKKIVIPDAPQLGMESLPITLARAFSWQRAIDEGKFRNTADLATALGIDQGVIARTLRLTLLAPEIVHQILHYELPENLKMHNLRGSLPVLWDEQLKVIFGQ